jgi:tetratricopeptide (TPR) repeat protein
LKANLSVSESQFADALKLYYEAIKIEPKSPKIYIHSGNVCVLTDDLVGAIKDYKKAVDLLPDDDETILLYYDTVRDYVNKKLNKET